MQTGIKSTVTLTIQETLDQWDELQTFIGAGRLIDEIRHGDGNITLEDFGAFYTGMWRQVQVASGSREGLMHVVTSRRLRNDEWAKVWCTCEGFQYWGHCYHNDNRP